MKTIRAFLAVLLLVLVTGCGGLSTRSATHKRTNPPPAKTGSKPLWHLPTSEKAQLFVISSRSAWAITTGKFSYQTGAGHLSVWHTNSLGDHWINVTPPALGNNVWIEQIPPAVFPNARDAFLVLGIVHIAPDGLITYSDEVLHTINSGQTWQRFRITDNLHMDIPTAFTYTGLANGSTWGGVVITEALTGGTGDSPPVKQVFETRDGGVSWVRVAEFDSSFQTN